MNSTEQHARAPAIETVPSAEAHLVYALGTAWFNLERAVENGE